MRGGTVRLASVEPEFASIAINQLALDAAPDDLGKVGDLGGMSAGLLPFFVGTSGVSRARDVTEHQVTFALTPAGCMLDSSDTVTIGADGTAHRTWVPRSDHLIEKGELTDLWWLPGADRYIPVAFGTATAASTDLVAVRLPGQSSQPVLGDRLLVVGPPAATKVMVGTAATPLIRRAGASAGPSSAAQ
jgi:hypothetical protein